MDVGDLAHQLVEDVLRLEAARLDVLEVVEDVHATRKVLGAQVGHARIVVYLYRVLLYGVDAELALELLRHGVFEQLAALRHDAPELVADGLVHDYTALCGCTAACS